MKNYLKIAGNIHLSYYIEAAEELGIEYEVIVRSLMAEFKYKDRKWFIINTATPLTNTTSATIAKRKFLTNKILSKYDIPVPIQKPLFTKEDVLEFFHTHNDIVIKPAQSLGGHGITILPKTDNEALEGHKFALEHNKSKDIVQVLGEKFIQGDNYRFLTLGSKVIGIVKRNPALVVGDGKSTINELIEKSNELRKEKFLHLITVDKEVTNKLRTQGYNLTSIPALNKVIKLRFNTNLTTGGTCEECAGIVHPYYKELAVKAIKAVGLEFGGVDLIARDITKIDECAINEINYNPGLRLHYKVDKGEIVRVAVDIMRYIAHSNLAS